MTLPEMTIEKRTGSAHNVPSPSFDYDLELEDTINLNSAAKFDDWLPAVIETLKRHIPFVHSEIKSSVFAVTGFESWREVCLFVQDDMCSEFFNMALSYCLREGQKHKIDKDFIDGSGIGYLRAYTRRLKTTLEQCFDAKWHYKLKRPLVQLKEEKGLDLSLIANHIHPGHWSYPAGHGTKFLTAVEVLNEVFHLDRHCYSVLLTAACVLAHGRSGNLIHYPSDNLAGGVLTNLNEFNTLS